MISNKRLSHRMTDDKVRSRDDSVEISLELVGRKESVKTAYAPPFPNLHDQTAQRGDEGHAASHDVSSSEMAQCRRDLDLVLSGTKREANANRRRLHIFDELPKVNLNTSLKHPGRSEMRFGDLDFDFDISVEWAEDADEKCATESMTLMSQLLNDAAASYVQKNAVSVKNR